MFCWVPVLSLLLESSIILGFLSSDLLDVYLLVIGLLVHCAYVFVLLITLHMFLFYLLSDNDHTISFDSYKVCTLSLLIE